MVDLCCFHVERMGQEVEEIQIVALMRALDISVGILDVAGSEISYFQHPKEGGAPPLCWVMHLPGHYDMVYPAGAYKVQHGSLFR